jgi:hypothetical protein
MCNARIIGLFLGGIAWTKPSQDCEQLHTLPSQKVAELKVAKNRTIAQKSRHDYSINGREHMYMWLQFGRTLILNSLVVISHDITYGRQWPLFVVDNHGHGKVRARLHWGVWGVWHGLFTKMP